MELELNLSELLKRMPIEKVFEVVQAAKKELQKRQKRDSVYEPTSRQDIDNAHYEQMRTLDTMLEKLKDV